MPDKEGVALPDSISLIYPGFCPIDKLISLADTPALVRSIASRNPKSFSSIKPPLAYIISDNNMFLTGCYPLKLLTIRYLSVIMYIVDGLKPISIYNR